MKLEKGSWIAGIVAAIVAIIALIVGILAWLVDKNDFIQFCRTYGTKVAAPFITAYNWLSHPITWPLWALIALALSGLVFVGLIALLIWLALKKSKGNEENPTVPKVPDEVQFQVEDYTEDTIFGVCWLWTYSGRTVNIPRPICPDANCQCDLSFREDWSRVKDGPNVLYVPPTPVTLHCRRCGFKREFDQTARQVLEDVTTEIIRLIRTDKFRERLAERLANLRASTQQRRV